MNKFKVSVIVNFHNGEKYLYQAIKSIIEQNYKNLEIILWDNCSNDKSVEIIKLFYDNRIKYFLNKKKVNLYKARNKAILASSGELIAFLDADDWWEKDYLSSREKLFSDQSYDFFYTNTNFFYQRSNKYKIYRNYKLPHGNIFNNLSKDYFLIISGVIFRREIFRDYGLFNENYNIIGDYDFLIKISQFCNAHSINTPLLNYRVHENNFSKLHSKMFYKEFKDWFNKNIFQDQNKNYLKNIEYFSGKLDYLDITNLILNEKKSFSLFIKILKHKSFKEKIKFIILFFTPKRFFKFLKK